jgi:hypothetical protein
MRRYARILLVVATVRRSQRRRTGVTAMHQANAVKATLPRCGAKCHRGGVCQNPGTGAGGRCPKHGGLTPSGDQWHVARLPPDGARLVRKLESLAERRKKRAAEIAAMSPKQRERYDTWCKTHRPGRSAGREARRRDREAREILERPRIAPVTPEIAALEAALADARARREALEALLADLTAEGQDQ